MLILTAAQARAVDALTCQTQGTSLLDLVERAAGALHRALQPWLATGRVQRILLCCGPGHNGGDGLALARLLAQAGEVGRSNCPIQVLALPAERPAADWLANRARLPAAVRFTPLTSEADLPPLLATDLVIDALFGTGLNRPLTGLAAAVVAHLNAGPATVVSVDLPSGLLTDTPTPPTAPVVQAAHTFTFQAPKLPLLLPATGGFAGEWEVLDIGLDLSQTVANQHLTEVADLTAWLRPRARFAHKGTYGHALLLAGARGKLGAAVLAARATLRAGVGLLTVQVPACGYDVLQNQVPEAMTLTDAADELTALGTDTLAPYQALGLGPGIGQHPATAALLDAVLIQCREQDLPLVLDADALNLLARRPDWRRALPPRCLLTPHPKEFERLAGPAPDDFARLDLLRQLATETGAYILLKGAFSVVAAPDGALFFNPTGNPGMATGGTGDALTGIILSLLAQGLPPLAAARLGMLAHGRAGDLARDQHGERGMTAGDLVNEVGRAFQALSVEVSQ